MTNTRATLLLLALAAVSTMAVSTEQATEVFIPSSPSNLRGDWNGRIKIVGVDTHDTASLEGFRLRGNGGTIQTHNVDISDEDENNESMNPQASETSSPDSDTATPPSRRRILDLKSQKSNRPERTSKTTKTAKEQKAGRRYESPDPALVVRTSGTRTPGARTPGTRTPGTNDPESPNTKAPVAIDIARMEVSRDNIRNRPERTSKTTKSAKEQKAGRRYESPDPALVVRTSGTRTPGARTPGTRTPGTNDPESPNTKAPVAIDIARMEVSRDNIRNRPERTSKTTKSAKEQKAGRRYESPERTEVPRDNIPFITEILLPEYNRSDDNSYDEDDEENFPGSNDPIFNREGFLTDYPTSDNNDTDYDLEEDFLTDYPTSDNNDTDYDLEEDYFDTAQTEAPGDSFSYTKDIPLPEYYNRDKDGYNEENFPGSNVPIYNTEGFVTNQFDIDSERVKSTLEAFDKAIEMSGSGASSDSLQLKYVQESAPEVGCPGDVNLVKQEGGRSLMTSDPILDAVKITHQDTSTVTVDLYQVWGKNNAPGYPVESFFYHFHKPGKRFWGNVECYEKASVPYSASEKLETIEISCNAGNSYASLELCVVDEISHGSLVQEDSSTTILPRQCNHEVSPTEAAVCYTLEINCQPPSEDRTC